MGLPPDTPDTIDDLAELLIAPENHQRMQQHIDRYFEAGPVHAGRAAPHRVAAPAAVDSVADAMIISCADLADRIEEVIAMFVTGEEVTGYASKAFALNVIREPEQK